MTEANYPPVEDFPLQVGDRVVHIKDASWVGVITQIDWNLIHLSYPSTTCRVRWGDDPDNLKGDIQWTNKLTKQYE